MITLASVWFLKFLIFSTAFALGYEFFARWRGAAVDRFLSAKILLFASPLLAFVTLPHKDIASFDFIPGDSVAQVVQFGASVAPESSTGVVVLTLYAAVAAFLLARLAWSLGRMARVARSGEIVGTWHGIPIVEHGHDMPPATFGVLQGRIYLPRSLAATLSQQDKEVIYSHEAVHVARSDFRWKLLARFVACFAFVSPAWLLLLRRFEEDMELSCDDLVRSGASVNSKDYAGLLVRLAETAGDSRQVPVCSMSSSFRPSILRRISAMKSEVIQSRKRLVFGLVAAALGLTAPVLLVGSRDSLAESPADVKLMDPSEGFILSVKADVKNGNGKTFKMEISRVVHPGKRTFLAGNDDVSIEFQYEYVDSNLETTWFVLDSEGKPTGTSKITIEPQHGATIEYRRADQKMKSSIEFWDVTKKRTIKDAQRDAELLK